MMPIRKKNTGKAVRNERKERIYNFLRSKKVGVLATVDVDNDPDVAAIYYFVEPDFTINFMTKTGTKKSINILRNNHIKLLVYEAKTCTTAQITGNAEKIVSTTETSEVFANILRSAWETNEDGVPPISRLLAGEYIAYKIKPKQVQMAVYVRPDYGNHAELFETLEAYELNS